MVLKALYSSGLEHEEEELYLRKCNTRRSKRQYEKSRKLAFEQLSAMERVPSPSPLKSSTPGRRMKSKAESGAEPPPSPRSTDDHYPVPSPPPRSPVFSSPAFGRGPLALSLNLMSPAGFTISGSKKSFHARYSPEPNVLSCRSVERSTSMDSVGGIGDITLNSPCSRGMEPDSCVSPELSEQSPRAGGSVDPDRGGKPEVEGNNTSNSKDSSRVKQFLFHRDRDRARKAQLMFTAAYGSSDQLYDEDEHSSAACTPLASRSAISSSSGAKSAHKSGGLNRTASAGKNHGDKYMRIDLETDIRAGTSGLVYTPTLRSLKARSPRSTGSSGSRTPSAAIAMQRSAPPPGPPGAGDDAGSPFGSSSPYYRALTLGVQSPPAAAGVVISKQQITVTAAGAGAEPSTLAGMLWQRGADSRHGSESPLSSSPYPDDVSSAEDSEAAYNVQFPALPVVRPVAPPVSALRGLQEMVKPTPTLERRAYTVEDICIMFHTALCKPVQQNECAEEPSAAPRVRAWDDADSDSDDDCAHSSNASVQSDNSSVDSNVAAAITTMQQQIRKLADVDATCASLMAKCEFIYDVLKHPVQRQFDAQWLQSMVCAYARTAGCPFTVVVDNGTADTAPSSVRDLLAQGYVHAGLLYQLVQALQFEDQRFESARLPLLYALYCAADDDVVQGEGQQACCVRGKIAAALEHACGERLQRCTQLVAYATALEMDVNYIAKVGYADLCSVNLTGACTQHSLATGCDLTAVIESDCERPNYKSRDSEAGLLELMRFVIAREVNAALVMMHGLDSGAQTWSEETKSSVAARAGAVTGPSATVAFYQSSRVVLRRLTSAYCYLFRCYTSKLGACTSGAAENVEQPAFLEQLLQCLDGLLAWAKVLCNLRDTTTSSALVAGTDRVLDEVCNQILRSTARHWTAQLNFAQDIAYILQSEVVLTIYAPAEPAADCADRLPLAVMVKRCPQGGLPPLFGNRVYTPENSSSAGASGHALAVTVLKRLLQRVTSAHAKVATQAIQSLQNPVIMVRYFLPRITTAMVSYIFGTEVGRITFLSGEGWSNAQREDCLNLLVDRLRGCREIHSGPSAPSQQLQTSSAQLLDTTLELLQVIEDAE